MSRPTVMELIAFSEKIFTPTFYGATKEEFVKKVNELYQGDSDLKEGYAPFCKHFFVENFTDAPLNAVEINDETEPLIKTAYACRTEKELPVLERWIPATSMPEVPKAKYLDVILYSRAQVKEECEEMDEEFTLGEGVEWGIVSIKPQQEDYETPMQPITMLRNALGKSEGGSGVPLEREKYQQSVDYWSKHVIVKRDDK